MIYNVETMEELWSSSMASRTFSMILLAILAALALAVACVGLYRFGKPFLAVIMLSLIIGAIVQNPLQQRMLEHGVRPEDRLLSRGIIEMREE